MAAAKAKCGEKGASSVQVGSANSNVGFDSPTGSTAHTNGNGSTGVTHLGVVGRGVKRMLTSGTAESSPAKKPATDSSDDKGDSKTSWSSGLSYFCLIKKLVLDLLLEYGDSWGW